MALCWEQAEDNGQACNLTRAGTMDKVRSALASFKTKERSDRSAKTGK
jgi:hypothetical protein